MLIPRILWIYAIYGKRKRGRERRGVGSRGGAVVFADVIRDLEMLRAF